MTANTDQQIFNQRGRHFLSFARYLFFLTGFLALAYVGLVLLHARSYQQQAFTTLDHQIQAAAPHSATLQSPAPRSTDTSYAAAIPPSLKEGDVVGRILIPRINVTVAILQGTTPQTLLLGVGHIDGTPLPGETGNSGIAGHRDTFFRNLRDLRSGDEIQIQTVSGISTYKVDWLQIIDPRDTAILTPSTGAELTLVTCYPFHYIGHAPERFAAQAHKIQAPTSTTAALALDLPPPQPAR